MKQRQMWRIKTLAAEEEQRRNKKEESVGCEREEKKTNENIKRNRKAKTIWESKEQRQICFLCRRLGGFFCEWEEEIKW